MLPEFWTLQSHAAQQIQNMGMVVTTDLVDNSTTSIRATRPRSATGLALLALDETYGKEVESSGLVFRKAKFGKRWQSRLEI